MAATIVRCKNCGKCFVDHDRAETLAWLGHHICKTKEKGKDEEQRG